jgi:hypothetical protein
LHACAYSSHHESCTETRINAVRLPSGCMQIANLATTRTQLLNCFVLQASLLFVCPFQTKWSDPRLPAPSAPGFGNVRDICRGYNALDQQRAAKNWVSATPLSCIPANGRTSRRKKRRFDELNVASPLFQNVSIAAFSGALASPLTPAMLTFFGKASEDINFPNWEITNLAWEQTSYLSAGAAHAFQDGQALLSLALDCCQLVLLHVAHFIEQAFLAFVQDLPQLRHPLLGAHLFVCVRVQLKRHAVKDPPQDAHALCESRREQGDQTALATAGGGGRR